MASRRTSSASINAKLQQVLRLNPEAEIAFKGPFNESVESTLVLTNPLDKVVFFNVMLTAPKYYCVRPNAGFILPNKSKTIKIHFQPTETVDVNNERFKIKSYVSQSEEEKNVPIEQLWKEVDQEKVMGSYLNVVFYDHNGTRIVTKEKFLEQMQVPHVVEQAPVKVTVTIEDTPITTKEAPVQVTPIIEEATEKAPVQMAQPIEPLMSADEQNEKDTMKDQREALVAEIRQVFREETRDAIVQRLGGEVGGFEILIAFLAFVIGFILAKLI